MIGFYNYTVILTYIGAGLALFGAYSAIDGSTSLAMLMLMLSGLCDMFDGTVAKTRKRTVQEKRFGIQIDSLSDLVCFGVLPAVIGYNLGMRDHIVYYIVLICYTLAALVRLAYFNVMEEERQQTTGGPRVHYEGLPVTNVALILPLVYSFREYIGSSFPQVYAVCLAIIAVAFVLKFKVIKLQMKGMLVCLVVGIAEFIWFVKGF